MQELEARAGIEPAHEGFADILSRVLIPSVYAGCASIAPGFGPALVRPPEGTLSSRFRSRATYTHSTIRCRLGVRVPSREIRYNDSYRLVSLSHVPRAAGSERELSNFAPLDLQRVHYRMHERGRKLIKIRFRPRGDDDVSSFPG